jgi:acyl carrier protein
MIPETRSEPVMEIVPLAEAIEMLVEVSEVPEIHPDTEFETLELDSLQSVEWLSMLEDRLGVEFNIREMDFSVFIGSSVRDVVDELYKQAVASAKD